MTYLSEWDRAANRVLYQLRMKRADVVRRFSYPGQLTGQDIDCAYNLGKTSRGGWYDANFDQLTEEEVVDWYQMMALQECVHEALEWFQVDGKSWLDPHIRDNKIAVRDAVIELWKELKSVRAMGHEYG